MPKGKAILIGIQMETITIIRTISPFQNLKNGDSGTMINLKFFLISLTEAKIVENSLII